MLVFFANLSLTEFQVRHLALYIYFFLSKRRLQVVLKVTSSQEFSVNAGVSQGSILGPTFFRIYINELPDSFICNIAIYASNSTLYSK